MNNRVTALAMTGVITSLFVFLPFNNVVAKQNSKQLVAQRPTTKALQNLSTQGEVLKSNVKVGNFAGTVSIKKFGYEQGGKGLTVSGVVNGAAFVNGVNQPISYTFENVSTTLRSSNTKQVGTCDILFLDLGPIFIDLLGLTIDLSEIILDINAVAGSGNLLGNLLCALVGLLDGGPLSGILQLIQQINAILARF